MIETVEVTINNKKYSYNKDTSLFEIAQDFKNDFKFAGIEFENKGE